MKPLKVPTQVYDLTRHLEATDVVMTNHVLDSSIPIMAQQGAHEEA